VIVWLGLKFTPQLRMYLAACGFGIVPREPTRGSVRAL
jgi:hypothetical protein